MTWTYQAALAAQLPATDAVYAGPDGLFVKLRVLRQTPPDPTQARTCRAFVVSAALCDAAGWALGDGAGGHQVAPSKSFTLLVQGIAEEAIRYDLHPAQIINGHIEAARLELCAQAQAFAQVLALDADYPDAVPTVVQP